VVALLLGAVLIGSTAWSYLGVRAASLVVTRGQAELLFRALRQGAISGWDTPQAADLARVVVEQSSTGLRYVAILGEGHRVLVSAGTPLGAADRAEDALLGEGELLRVGDRIRTMQPPPPRPPGDRAPPPPRRDRPPPPAAEALPPRPGDDRPPRRPPAPLVLIELVPLLANQLEARALQNLAVSAAAALLLSAAAAVLFRRSVRADEAEAELLRQRHLVSLGEMSAVLAHEIRNPLASLKGHAQLIAELFPEGDRDRERVDRVVAEAVRLEQLTNQLLDLARTGKIARRSVAPAALLQEAAADAGEEAFTLSLGAAPPAWPLDPVQMRQVLGNLLANAREASPPGVRAEAELRVEAGRLVLLVRDHGRGIPAAEIERIFEPFHTTRTRGTGLGLTVAKRIVELHGGTLEASNHPAGGALFRVAIPEA
jgi:two-component system sensor histidine kinase HydH